MDHDLIWPSYRFSGSGSVHLTNGSGRPKNYRSDPDPEHCHDFGQVSWLFLTTAWSRLSCCLFSWWYYVFPAKRSRIISNIQLWSVVQGGAGWGWVWAGVCDGARQPVQRPLLRTRERGGGPRVPTPQQDRQVQLPAVFPVFRIHDILVWIRIRGCMPLTYEPWIISGSCYFRHWPSRHQQKTILKKFCLLLFEGTFTSFFKDKKSK